MTAVYVVRVLPSDPFGALAGQDGLVVLGNRPRPPTRDVLVAEARDAEALVPTYVDRVDTALLEALPRLRLIASYGVGTNHLDLDACRRHGVTVTNTPGVLTDTTADHAFALLLAAARRVAEGDRLVRRGGWRETDPGFFLGTNVSGKTLGLVGFGRIGQAVARRARGFDMPVLYAAPRETELAGARRVPLEVLLAESDFVSLHVPLTPATEGMFDAAAFARMKPGAILVNTARGPVVDDGALAAALRSGRLAAAGLDVFRDEPRVPPEFLGLENVVLTPHLGSGTRETRAAMASMVAEEVVRFARGAEPLHPVT